jgi:hypothetical protein
MYIVMTRKTLWQNMLIPIGAEFTVPKDIGIGLIRRNCAIDKNANAAPNPVVPTKEKKHKAV